MAEAQTNFVDPPEQADATEDEEEWIQKIKDKFGEEIIDLCEEIDIRRIIRAYATEKEREKETFEKTAMWLDALVDDFVAEGLRPMENQEMYEKAKVWGEITAHGQDKYGHPVIWENLSTYDIDNLKANLDFAIKYRRRVHSQAYNKKIEECRARNKTLYKQIVVMNMDGIGVTNATRYKNVIQLMIAIESNLFCETAYRVHFVNTSFFFWAAWKVVSMFVHPITAKKIQMHSGPADAMKALQEDIDIDQIPPIFKLQGESKMPVQWGESSFSTPIKLQVAGLAEKLKEAGYEPKEEGAGESKI